MPTEKEEAAIAAIQAREGISREHAERIYWGHKQNLKKRGLHFRKKKA